MPGRKVGSLDIQFGSGYDQAKANQLVQSLEQVIGAVNTLANEVSTLEASGSGTVAKHELAGETGLGPVHTVSGLTAGQVLVATSATVAEFAALKFGQLAQTDPATFAGVANGDVIAFINGYWSAVPFSTSIGLANPGSDALIMWDTLANGGTGGLTWALAGLGIHLMSGSVRVDDTQLTHGHLLGLLADDHPQYALVGAPNTFTGSQTIHGDLILAGNLEQTGIEGVEERIQNTNDLPNEGTWRVHVEPGQEMWASVSDPDPGYALGADGEDWLYVQRIGELVDTVGISAANFDVNAPTSTFAGTVTAAAFYGVGGGTPSLTGPPGPPGPPGAMGPPGSGGGSSWAITDGTHTVTGVTQLTVTGGTVGGATPNATLTVTGGGSGTVTSVTLASAGSTIAISGTNPITTSGTVNIDLPVSGVTAGSYTNTNLTVDAEGRITAAASGVSSKYPLNFVQWYPFQSGASNTLTYTVTFPQAAAASGNTLFMALGVDGSSAFTAPAGWTVDINQPQTLYSRFILMHKTAASDTSAVLTIGSASTFAGFFFEVTGAHALDQSSSGGVAIQQFLGLPSITPASGAAVFGAMAYTSNTTVAYTQANEPAGSPTWKSDYMQASGVVAGRGLLMLEYLPAASGGVVNPPYLQFPAWQFYASSGLAYSTFSIL